MQRRAAVREYVLRAGAERLMLNSEGIHSGVRALAGLLMPSERATGTRQYGDDQSCLSSA